MHRHLRQLFGAGKFIDGNRVRPVETLDDLRRVFAETGPERPEILANSLQAGFSLPLDNVIDRIQEWRGLQPCPMVADIGDTGRWEETC